MLEKTNTFYDEDLLVDGEQGQEEHINKRSKGNCSNKQDHIQLQRERKREANRHKLCNNLCYYQEVIVATTLFN